ncbi:metallophosphoesterase [Agromyces sp. SYSU K20354]|uniref:metallophosphoesterase n=1 Tax=Agromyces cavernae TaxID=2898659 RepID=UPI001E3202AB|nr:metallophosphoesterase [Agromyces cavernae]MCD2443629.1 metallophosphoesterase [Agromyces cavernae]
MAAPAASAAPLPMAKPTPTTPASAPTLTPEDGAWLEGSVTVAADATTAGDPVASLEIDGESIGATTTPGVSHLRFDIGSNSAAVSFHNWIVVNGHRIDQDRTWVSERVDLEVPNEWLVTGENIVEIFAGTADAACGVNYDDFVLTDVSLELLGEVADGEDNPFSYNFGDGDCGTQPNDITEAALSFFVLGDPLASAGLAAEVDTTTLANGPHEIVATTVAGGNVTHAVAVNNAPVGAPLVAPVDGTLVRGIQYVSASQPAGEAGGVAALTVDGAAPPAAASLGTGSSVFSFDVGSNSIEHRYQNHLLVNGHKVDILGDFVSTRVEVPIPNRYLVAGDNEIVVVAGDISSSCGANLDDFTISNLGLAIDEGTAAGQDVAAAYSMGDGSCGSATTALPTAETQWTIDAPAVSVLQTLGAGEATFSFDVGSNSIDPAFENELVVNGIRHVLGGVYVSERANVVIPNEWLLPGWNTVEVVTGTTATGCNRDDFAISNVALTPASGTATGQRLKTSYAMCDGTCGSNINSFTEIDLHFVVEGATAQGLRTELDTTAIADGTHVVAATSTTGETATRQLLTDNTGPAITSSTPVAGATITSSVALDVELDDASGLMGAPEFALDGEVVAPGALVGPGFAAGEHTIAVTATDALGNRATREVVFASAGIPDVPADLAPASGTTDVSGTVTLEATVGEPDGGDVEATFTQAEILTPNQGWQGSSTGVLTTLRVPGERNAGDTRALAPGDGATLDVPASREVAYQRFDVQVKGAVAEPVLRWEGVIDPTRVVSLRAWNLETSVWEVLASSRGTLEGDTELSAIVDSRYIDGQQVHVMITGEDPFADELDAGAEGFADPSSYDFSIAHFTDTQYLSEGAVEQETAAERAIWEQAYGDTTRWIAANADERKIAYVAHTGDIIENNIRTPGDEAMMQQVIGEFEVSSRQQRILDEAGVTNQVIAGNHDNRSGTEDGPEALYNQYYGPDRYAAADDQWTDAEYGGPWREGDNQNSYTLFSAGGLDFVSVGLSYGITREEAEWADAIYKRFPDRNGILLSHDYLAASTQTDGRNAGFAAPDGSMLYKTIVEDNPNVFLILAGHVHGVGTNVKPEVGQVGHGVVELLADYQAYTITAEQLGLSEIGGYQPMDRLRFGASYLRLLQFDVDRAEMIVDTYSPFLDDFGADEYDPALRYGPAADNMVLPVDITSRTTTFRTDSLALYNPIAVIGETTVASGEVASVDWTGLKRGSTYAWFVVARSAGGGVTPSLPSVFVTNGGQGKTGTVAPRNEPEATEIPSPTPAPSEAPEPTSPAADAPGTPEPPAAPSGE